MSNIINYVKPSKGQSRKDINKILELITDFVAPNVEEGGAQQRITVTPHVRKYTSSVRFGGIDWPIAELRDRENFIYRRRPSSSPDTYPLTQTEGGSPLFPVKDTKFGARMDYVASGNTITIPDDPILNVTDKLTIAGWFHFPATQSGDGVRNLVLKGSQYLLRIDPHSEQPNQIAFFPYNPSAEPRVSFVYTPDTWFHLVVTYDSGVGAKIYKDKVLQDSDTDTGSLGTTGNNLIFGIGTGAVFGHRIAHLTMIHNACTQSWIDDNFDGILDTTGDNIEIGYWPHNGNRDPQPEATAGLCST